MMTNKKTKNIRIERNIKPWQTRDTQEHDDHETYKRAMIRKNTRPKWLRGTSRAPQ